MDLLAGLHSRIIHFPVAFFILYFMFETGGTILKKDYLLKSAYIILILGVISSVAAVLTGNQAFETAKLVNSSNNIKDFIEQHEQYATITLWYFTLVLFLRTYLLVKKKYKIKYQYLFIIISLIGVLFVLLTGYYGGELVLKFGVGTKLFGK